MKRIVFGFALLASFSSFALTSGLKLVNAKTSGTCIDGLGGKFTISTTTKTPAGKEAGTSVDVFVSKSFCEVDSMYRPTNVDAEVVVVQGQFYLKELSFGEVENSDKNFRMRFVEDVKAFSKAEIKKINSMHE